MTWSPEDGLRKRRKVILAMAPKRLDKYNLYMFAYHKLMAIADAWKPRDKKAYELARLDAKHFIVLAYKEKR